MEKPTLKQRFDSFMLFLWNPEEKKVLGRGGRSWAEIGLFYLIYYTCLAAFFVATIAVFYETIDSDHPKLQGDDSLLKGNPGMGFQPNPDIDSTLVRTTKDKALQKHMDSLKNSYEKVLKGYAEAANKTADCSGTTTREGNKTACKVDLGLLTEKCNAANYYGMKEDKPCVLLKLNKIYGWVPDVWENAAEAGDRLPEQVARNYTNDKIWVYCHGENPADEDNIGLDDITYYPEQGFPLKYYPYLKQENYKPPLVFVQFGKVTPYIGLMVECVAYAKNIKVDATDKEGSVHFELLSDPILY